MSPRGIRNNNPGNIEYNENVKWQGLEGIEEHGSPRFAKFKSPTYGIRAIAKLLITYQDKYGINTINGIIKRWAPSVENDTKAYIQHVSRVSGIAKNEHLDLHSFEDLSPIVQAIILHENGQQPYTEQQITKGLVLAGVEPPKSEGLKGSRTVRGGQLATTGVLGSAGADVLKEATGQMEGLAGYHDYFLYAFLALSLLGILYMMWARLDDHRKGLR